VYHESSASEAAIQDTEVRVVASAFELMDRQPQRSMDREQMTLPSRHAGLGLRSTNVLECHAAYMSAAARAQIATSEGPKAFQPLLGLSAAGLPYKWAALHTDVAAPVDWGPRQLLNEERSVMILSWHD
jgi:hypothetical protein